MGKNKENQENQEYYRPGHISKIFEDYAKKQLNHEGKPLVFIKPTPEEKKKKSIN